MANTACGCRALAVTGRRRTGAWLLGALGGLGVAMAAEPPATAPAQPATAHAPGAVLEEAPVLTGPDATLRRWLPTEPAAFPPSRPPAAAQPVASAARLAGDLKAADEKVAFQCDLDAAPLSEVVAMFARLLGFGYMMDPAVKGAVTLKVDTELPARELWAMLEHILEVSGAYASRSAGYVHILPFAMLPKERGIVGGPVSACNVGVAVVPVRHVPCAELAGVLKPFLTGGGAVAALPPTNSVLLVDVAGNLPKLQELVSRLDTRHEAAWPHVCIQLDYADAGAVAAELESLLPTVGFGAARQGPDYGQVKLVAIPRLHVIVASAATQEVLGEVERWCRSLDRVDQSEQEHFFFYNARHSRAAELGAMLTSLLDGTPGSLPGPDGGLPSAGAAAAGPAAPSSAGRPEPQPLPGGGSAATRPLALCVDAAHNRLVLRTTMRDYVTVLALLQRLDVPATR